MICHRCGAEISDNSIRCTNCGIRVNMYCPSCGRLNRFGDKNCRNCGTELLAACKKCGASNMYFSKECRKCGAPMKLQEIPAEEAQQPIEQISDNNSNRHAEYVSAPEQPQEIQPVSNPQEETAEINNDIPETVSNNEPSIALKPQAEDKAAVTPEDTIGMMTDRTDINYTPESDINAEAAAKAVNMLANPKLNTCILGITGPEGSGKTSLLKQICDIMTDKGCLSLSGTCTPLVQITSFGFFQDAFFRLMGFPPYAKSRESFDKDFSKSHFAKVFSFLSSSELTNFLNIFYPSQKDVFDNIIKNKKYIFSILEKIMRALSSGRKLIITADNLELLDGASYDFIIYMMKKKMFGGKIKLIAAYEGSKDIRSYFDAALIDDSAFETIELDKLNKNELLFAAEQSFNLEIRNIPDEEIIDELVSVSDGNASRMEQETAYLFDIGCLKLQDRGFIVNKELKPAETSGTFEELVKKRLQTLPEAAQNVLYTAAMLGCRFAYSILCIAVPMPVEKAQEVITFLIRNMYLQHADTFSCEFKSLALWKCIYQEAKADRMYAENAKRLYMSLRPLVLSNGLQKLISCSAAMSENEEFIIWQNSAAVTAKLGDTNLYVISLKQCLKLIDFQEVSNAAEEKLKMYEEIGKLLCSKSPQEAVTYLSNALDAYIKTSNILKIIDISSWFIKSCYLSGSSFGAAEAADAVLAQITSSDSGVSALDIALIKTRKLKALLNLGNSGEVIHLIENEILPEIEQNLTSEKLSPKYKNILIDAWFNSQTALAKAFIMQGSNKAEMITARLYAAADRYKYKSRYYKLKTDLIYAFAKTLSGEINKSSEILNKISEDTDIHLMEEDFTAWIQLCDVLNRVLSGKFENLKNDLFELAAQANNINEHFIKNIAKLILGYITKAEGNSEKAEEIYSEQIEYFSKTKSAIGALAAWLLIVQKYIEEGQIDKAFETASKSLEIAQDAKINNYIYTVYFQRYLAEIYILKGDSAAAGMYLEKAAGAARQLNLKYQMIEIYISYAQYLQEAVRAENSASAENIKAIKDVYRQAAVIADDLQLPNMIDLIGVEYSNFEAYCRMNAIEI